METQSELAYHKNFGYYWITGLNKAVFLACCAVLGGMLLALFPILFATVELTALRKNLLSVRVTKVDVGITVVGCFVASMSMITLFVGFMLGDWVWATCFFGLYGGLCALVGLFLGTAFLSYVSVADEAVRLEINYDGGFA